MEHLSAVAASNHCLCFARWVPARGALQRKFSLEVLQAQTPVELSPSVLCLFFVAGVVEHRQVPERLHGAFSVANVSAVVSDTSYRWLHLVPLVVVETSWAHLGDSMLNPELGWRLETVGATF